MNAVGQMQSVVTFYVSALHTGWDGVAEPHLSGWVASVANLVFGTSIEPARSYSGLGAALPSWIHVESEPPLDSAAGAPGIYIDMSAAHGYSRRFATVIGGSQSGESFLKVEVLSLSDDDLHFCRHREKLVGLFGEVAAEFSRGAMTECWYDPLARDGWGITGLSPYGPSPREVDAAWLRSRALMAWATLLRSEHLSELDEAVRRALRVEVAGDDWAVVSAPFPPSSRRFDDWARWCATLAPVTGRIDLDRARADGVVDA